MTPATGSTPHGRESFNSVADEALIIRYRDQRDVSAFEELIHRYEKPLFNYLLRYLGDAALAEDVFQATFLRLHEKCGLYTPGRRLRPWLYSIATHQAIDALRKERRHAVISLDEKHSGAGADATALLEMLRSRTSSPLQQLEERERAEWTRRAVDALPHDVRVAILLIYFHGFKYHEAAESLGLPLGTLKSRVHKGLILLNQAWRADHRQEEAK